MGNFRVTINGVGNHGCQRDKGDGELIGQCDNPNCPDCIARRFVAELQAKDHSFSFGGSAKLEHWPDTPGTVTDDLLTGIRTGSF